jgi:hypothetical protein
VKPRQQVTTLPRSIGHDLARKLSQATLTSCFLLLVSGIAHPVQGALLPHNSDGSSPALCSEGDNPEPGIQGDVPDGETANYHCGLTLVGELTDFRGVSAVQGAGDCAYLRSGTDVYVIDVSNPQKPVWTGAALPVASGSETMRAVVTDERAVLVSGSSVYDIQDCRSPVLKGEIEWPPLSLPGIPVRLLPHDIRVTRDATKVLASFGLWIADISDLENPDNWTVTDHRCELAAQQPGPWQSVHEASLAADRTLCDDAADTSILGANYAIGVSPLQASLLWPSLSHAPDTNADDTRVYVGDQAGGTGANWAPVPMVRIIDITRDPPEIVSELEGPGHGLDWFQIADGREFLLHSNEAGAAGVPRQADGGDTCEPYPRSTALGWGFEVLVSNVTGDKGRPVSMLTLAINDPEFCNVRQESGHDPWVSYHIVDDPLNATFAAVSFGTAGLRIFDIRRPITPVEVAYFNHGPLVHAGVTHYDHERKLFYVPSASGLQILKFREQVLDYFNSGARILPRRIFLKKE